MRQTWSFSLQLFGITICFQLLALSGEGGGNTHTLAKANCTLLREGKTSLTNINLLSVTRTHLYSIKVKTSFRAAKTIYLIMCFLKHPALYVLFTNNDTCVRPKGLILFFLKSIRHLLFTLMSEARGLEMLLKGPFSSPAIQVCACQHVCVFLPTWTIQPNDFLLLLPKQFVSNSFPLFRLLFVAQSRMVCTFSICGVYNVYTHLG